MADPYRRYGAAAAAAAVFLPPSADTGSIPIPSFPSHLSSEVSTFTNNNPSSSNDLWGSSKFLQKDQKNGKGLKNKHKTEKNGKCLEKKFKTEQSSHTGTGKGKPSCEKCGKKHEGRCLKRNRICYRCGNKGHFVKDCTHNQLEKVEKSKKNVGVFALPQQGAEEDTRCKKCGKRREGECLKGTCYYRCGNERYFVKDRTQNQQEKVENQSKGNILPSRPGAYGIKDIAGVRPKPSLAGLTSGASIRGYPSSFEDPNLRGHQRDVASGISPGIPDMTYDRPISMRTEGLPVPAAGDSNILYVDGLPKDCSRREIGRIVDIISGDKAMVLCFVEFTDAKCALTAKEALQGYKFDDKKPDSPVLSIYFAHFPSRLPSDRDEQ
ncbi:RRM domain-containing protein [Forsythia ovata]|uniref:RRM domain-containing protein n=1 Tax=Forsythia ovata TaxID=205694 RepID=A0ABD1RP43_9LAMI